MSASLLHRDTLQALTVGVLLQQKSIEDLNQRITYTRDESVNYNPITEKHVETGMTLKELAGMLRFDIVTIRHRTSFLNKLADLKV